MAKKRKEEVNHEIFPSSILPTFWQKKKRGDVILNLFVANVPPNNRLALLASFSVLRISFGTPQTFVLPDGKKKKRGG